jgi:putative ABC transport system permease protein
MSRIISMVDSFNFYANSVEVALRAIFAHRLRALLTLTGLIIGVSSIVIVGGFIEGLNSFVTSKIAKIFGINHFVIVRLSPNIAASDQELLMRNRRNKEIGFDDLKWLRQWCSLCSEVGARASTQINIKAEGREILGTQIIGVTANIAAIEDKIIDDGRFIFPHEESNSSMVCVIGADLKDKFFPGLDPIGKTLNIAGLPMRIVGVEERRGSMFGQSLDNHAYIPITTYQHLFGIWNNLELHGKAANDADFHLAVEEARGAMRNKHKLIGDREDDFDILDSDQIKDGIDQFTDTIVLFSTPVTLVSLIVGGIVVMNIMLVSVSERRFEIGLRKAVGATRGEILLQFLIEALVLSILGGILGLALSALVCWLVSKTIFADISMPARHVILSFIISVGIGVICGIYPAYKASQLEPINALSSQ